MTLVVDKIFIEGLGKILDEWTVFYRSGMLLQVHKNAGGGLDPYHHLVVMNSPYVGRICRFSLALEHWLVCAFGLPARERQCLPIFVCVYPDARLPSWP